MLLSFISGIVINFFHFKRQSQTSCRAQCYFLLFISSCIIHTLTSAVICVHTLWSKVSLQTTKIELFNLHFTVNGWSSTLPTSIAALSSKVFVAPVNTWWSFILYRSNRSLIFELKTIQTPVPVLTSRHICLDLRQRHSRVSLLILLRNNRGFTLPSGLSH